MDISIGSYQSDQSFSGKAKSVYRRLTIRAKVLLGILLLLFIYLLWPFGGSTESSSFKSITLSKPSYGSKALGSVSESLNNPQNFHKMSLSYLNLPPFLNAHGQYPNYQNGGNMLLSRKGDYVRLTKDESDRSGFLASNIPISYNDLSAVEIEIEFKMHGEQDSSSLIGDGMAIWLTSEPITGGEVFGANSAWDGLAIIIDTYRNFRAKKNRNVFPYLNLQRNYGNAEFYNKAKDGFDTQTGGCSVANIYNNENPTKMRITYIRSLKIFEISADIKGDGNWKVIFRREDELVGDYFPLGRGVYLGISAETGQLHQITDIHNIKVTSFRTVQESEVITLPGYRSGGFADVEEDTIEAPTVKPQRRTLNRLRKQEQRLRQADFEKYGHENGFVGWFFEWVSWCFILFMKLILVALGLYGCRIAYRIYKNKQKQNQKKRGGLL